jgi:hypothetical protein
LSLLFGNLVLDISETYLGLSVLCGNMILIQNLIISQVKIQIVLNLGVGLHHS